MGRLSMSYTLPSSKGEAVRIKGRGRQRCATEGYRTRELGSVTGEMDAIHPIVEKKDGEGRGGGNHALEDGPGMYETGTTWHHH